MPSLGDFSELIQAMTGIVSFILAIVVALQQRKIKELADVVVELKESNVRMQEQNTIMNNRLQLERLLTLEERIPVFEYHGVHSNEAQLWREIQVLNIGRKAFSIWIEILKGAGYRVQCTERNLQPKHVLTLHIKYDNRDAFHNVPFHFTIHCTNSYGVECKQEVVKNGIASEYSISPPNHYY